MKPETIVAPAREERIAIQLLRTDGGTQSRAEIDHEHTIPDYCELIKAAWKTAEFHALEERSADIQDFFRSPFDENPIAFYDGKDYWLADGFHRTLAFKSESIPFVDVNVYDGTRRDAILYAAGANAKHGLRRTNKDKKHAVTQLLNDSEWRTWSDNKIAQTCAVSQPFVSSLRGSLITVISENAPAGKTYTTKHGTTATMNTANIGKSKSSIVANDVADEFDDDSEEAEDSQESTQGNVPAESNSATELPASKDREAIEKIIDEIELYQALRLHGHRGVRFRSQAILWYEKQELFKKAHALLSHIRFDSGPVSDAIRVMANIPAPTKWKGCSRCKGTTRVGERFDPCDCKGGYVADQNHQGVDADVVADNAPKSV